MRDRAPEVVSVAAKVKELQIYQHIVRKSHLIFWLTWPDPGVQHLKVYLPLKLPYLPSLNIIGFLSGRRCKMQEIILRMLMISFPRLIWAASAWSPSRRAFFLVSKISTDVVWKISTISRIFFTWFKGIKSTMALRKRAVPILTIIGNKNCWDIVDFADRGLVTQVNAILCHSMLSTHISCLAAIAYRCGTEFSARVSKEQPNPLRPISSSAQRVIHAITSIYCR